MNATSHARSVALKTTEASARVPLEVKKNYLNVMREVAYNFFIEPYGSVPRRYNPVKLEAIIR
jgi:hypothetical protein